MPRYFLTQIAVEGFRGINNEGAPLELKFDADRVNSVFAVNGNGKSSLFEALSFAIKGSIPKLDRLQAAERALDYYANKFHSDDKARIDLEFTSDDDPADVVAISVVREADGTRTLSSSSGHADPEGFLSALNEEFTLLDHDTFQRFMEDKPLQRGRSFSSLLGLSKYSDFRQSLQSACDARSFNADFDVKSLQTTLAEIQKQQQALLVQLRRSYEEVLGVPLEDVSNIPAAAEQVSEALSQIEILEPFFKDQSLFEVDFEKAKKKIQLEEGGEKRKEFQNLVAALARLDAIEELDEKEVAASIVSLRALLQKKAALIEGTQGELFRKFLRAADELLRNAWENDAECPLCGEDFKGSLQSHVIEHLKQFAEIEQLGEEIHQHWQDASWPKLAAQLEQLADLDIEQENRVSANYAARFENKTCLEADLDSAFDRYKELLNILNNKKTELGKRKDELEKELPASLVKLTQQLESANQFSIAGTEYAAAEKRLSETNANIQIRERWRAFIAKGASDFSNAETALSQQTMSLIDGRYKELFGRVMNVGDIVPQLERPGQQEHLNVKLSDFHGLQDLSAQPLLSESYSNALAISIFLAAAANHTGVPRFIVLDDVTSSFDTGHQFELMEAIRTSLKYCGGADGMQFVILSHDGLLQKYFETHGGNDDWKHYRLQGSAPMGEILIQGQSAEQLKPRINGFLDVGQIEQAYPLIRQYLEFKLHQIIRKLNIPVPLDFAIRDDRKMVSNSLDAINNAIQLHADANKLVIEAQQIADLSKVHVPAIFGNWVSHYETGSTASFSVPMLRKVTQSIDELSECFRFDHTANGQTQRLWYKSLSKKL